MSVTRDRVDELRELERQWVEEASDPPPPEAPPVSRRPSHRKTRPAPTADRPPPWRPEVVLAAAWIAVLGVIFATEPAPADPTAAIPLWEALVASAFFAALPAALFGLVARRPWGAGVSLLSAGLGAALAIGCFATAHHAGLYPYGELAAFAGLGWFSWRRRRIPSPSDA